MKWLFGFLIGCSVSPIEVSEAPDNGLPPVVLGAATTYEASQDRLLLFGGAWPGRHPAQDKFSGETWVYQPGRWNRLDVIGPSPRANAAMAYDPVLERTILFGGTSRDYVYGDTWAFSEGRWTQLVLALNPPPAWGARMIFDSEARRLVLFGGQTVEDKNAGPPGGLYVLTEQGWEQQW